MESEQVGLQHDEALARVNYGLLMEWATPPSRTEPSGGALEPLAGLEGTEPYGGALPGQSGVRAGQAGRLAEAVRAADFLNADRFTLKSQQRSAWWAAVVDPALRLAAACGRDELVAGLIIRSRVQGVRLSSVHYVDEDWQDEDLPLGPLPALVHPSDQAPVTGSTSDGSAGTACYFM